MKRQIVPLQDTRFDVLILGGGITGAGLALDAVLRGFRVALIDKGDFASGTSSVSSKLVHGGLRYLEHGDWRLVHEALTERRLLLHNAPQLVQPLRFVIPFHSGSRVPRWKWRLGLTLYDFLAGTGNLQRSQPIDGARLLREVPGLRAAGLWGGAAYFDAQMDDARLCVEVMRSAALQGAAVANYVEAVAFERTDGSITGVRALDRHGGQEVVIRARQIVNATGPWVDAVCRLAGDTAGPHLRPTKGTHLIAPNRTGLTAALLLLHPADGRVFFVIPWPPPGPYGSARHGSSARRGSPDPAVPRMILIGTTDTFGDDSPDALTATPDEVTYLIEGHNHFLRPALEPADLLATFSGLRPLLRADRGTPSALSREFRVIESSSGLLSVAGGKYTTYRHMAEVAIDVVARRLGRHRPSRTRDFQLDGAPERPWREFAASALPTLQSRYGLSAVSAQHLVGRYGRRAFDVADYLRDAPELGRPVLEGEPDLQVEWPYQRDHEMALTPADHLLRRSRLGLYRPELLR